MGEERVQAEYVWSCSVRCGSWKPICLMPSTAADAGRYYGCDHSGTVLARTVVRVHGPWQEHPAGRLGTTPGQETS